MFLYLHPIQSAPDAIGCVGIPLVRRWIGVMFVLTPNLKG